MKDKSDRYRVVPESEILDYYRKGLTIQMLTDHVAVAEGTRKREAIEKVESILYSKHLPSTAGNR